MNSVLNLPYRELKLQKNCNQCSSKNFGVRHTQTADWQVNEVNLVVNIALPDSLSLNVKSSKVCCRDGNSVKAFHNNVYLIYACRLSAFVCTLKNFLG